MTDSPSSSIASLSTFATTSLPAPSLPQRQRTEKHNIPALPPSLPTLPHSASASIPSSTASQAVPFASSIPSTTNPSLSPPLAPSITSISRASSGVNHPTLQSVPSFSNSTAPSTTAVTNASADIAPASTSSYNPVSFASTFAASSPSTPTSTPPAETNSGQDSSIARQSSPSATFLVPTKPISSGPRNDPAITSSALSLNPQTIAPVPPTLSTSDLFTTPSHVPFALGTMTPAEAQRFGLGHLQNIGPGTSYSSPPQPFRPPTAHVSQPLPPRSINPVSSLTAQPSNSVSTALSHVNPNATVTVQTAPVSTVASASVPTLTPTPAPTSATAFASSSIPISIFSPAPPKLEPVVPGLGTGPLTVPGASSSSSSTTTTTAAAAGTTPPSTSTSAYATSDSIRAIPTNKNNPAFLNKLQSMVDDPSTDELICWSPDGSSFFVPNHHRFGNQVLPRFFKHNRFSSFVRQLNMYGFHKVPHLQQGALKHDSPTETELWEFSNPHFHRDHPEWISKVQRKKGIRDHGDPNHVDKDPHPSQELTHAGALMKSDVNSLGSSDDGILQLASVVNAINAIKNSQSNLTADLRSLQTSHQSLWQEALESRQRAKRQQETINKILRFLAGVFGTQDGEDVLVNGKKSSTKGRGGRRVAVRPIRNGRLMIQDGKQINSTDFEELELPTDEEEDVEEMPIHLRFQEATNGDSPKASSPSSPPTSVSGDVPSRFTTIGSPTKPSTDLPQLLAEITSTPSGSRRIPPHTSNQVLNALASSEGNAWLASLFGANLAGQGAKPATASSSHGFKLDPQMIAALQQALVSGSSTEANLATSGPAQPESSRFSYATSPGSNSSSNSNSNSGSLPAASCSIGPTTNPSSPSDLDPISKNPSDSMSKQAGLSQALVQSPSKTSFNPSDNVGGGKVIPNLPLESTHSNNQQMALSLARATRDLQNTSSDVGQVQQSINTLLEGLRIDPSMLQAISAGSAGQADPNLAVTSQGWTSGIDASFSQPWPVSMPDASQPPSTFAQAAVDGDRDPFGEGLITSSPYSGTTSGSLGIDNDFDVDSFLNQFVDTQADEPSPAPFNAPSLFDSSSSVPTSGLGVGGGLEPSSNDSLVGESPSFAFSPNTASAFLYNSDLGTSSSSSSNQQLSMASIERLNQHLKNEGTIEANERSCSWSNQNTLSNDYLLPDSLQGSPTINTNGILSKKRGAATVISQDGGKTKKQARKSTSPVHS